MNEVSRHWCVVNVKSGELGRISFEHAVTRQVAELGLKKDYKVIVKLKHGTELEHVSRSAFTFF